MKLQKLLYFSQLVHLAKFNEPLFNERIYAFENGCVVEEVRQGYHRRHDKFISESYLFETEFSAQVKETLLIVESIFGPLTGYELSDINHTHESWKESYDRSIWGPFRFKEFGEISLEQLKRNELNDIKNVVEAYEQGKDLIDFIEIKGRKFYFDPTQMKLNEEVLDALESFDGPDQSYTIYMDDSAGLVIY